PGPVSPPLGLRRRGAAGGEPQAGDGAPDSHATGPGGNSTRVGGAGRRRPHGSRVTRAAPGTPADVARCPGYPARPEGAVAHRAVRVRAASAVRSARIADRGDLARG